MTIGWLRYNGSLTVWAPALPVALWHDLLDPLCSLCYGCGVERSQMVVTEYCQAALNYEWVGSTVIWVKMQLRGLKLYKEKGTLFQEESYLPRIFRSSSLNLHTFHLINIVFWWQIFCRKHGKLTPYDQQDHYVLVVEVGIMTSQCRCMRAFSQSHVTKHDNHMPVTPLIGSGLAVMSMAAIWHNHIGKNIKITFKLRPSIHNHITNLFAKAYVYQVGRSLLEMELPFS